MSDYRLYFLDDNNRIKSAIVIMCDGDKTAVRLAEERAGAHSRFELWQRARKVKTWNLPPDLSPPSHLA
jgi:hypothetical protein